MLPQEFLKIIGLSKMQFPASLDRNWLTRKVLCSQKMKHYDLPIIIVSFQLFIFNSINKCKKNFTLFSHFKN